MSAKRECPECGAELPADAAEGLCPKCLMKAGLESGPDLGATVADNEGIVPWPGLPGPGQLFGGYRIVRELGRGGMGAVYDAEHLESGRRVALKVLSHQLESAESRARFLREGRLAASINHPNSVYVYGTEEIDGTPAIAMELVSGGTLQDRVKRDGPLPVREAVDAALQLVAGLEAAQAIGILHRDIKPANCFEDADGTVKIGDFGLSISTEARGDISLTQTGVFLGTPAFCSPEQLRGEELNVRSDMYSVGMTLYYLLTGRTPFEADNMVKLLATVLEKTPPSPRQFQPRIPRALANVVLRCLEKTAGDRFRNYAELRKALAPYSSTAPVPAAVGRRFLAGLLDSGVVNAMTATLSLAVMFLSPLNFGPSADLSVHWSPMRLAYMAFIYLVMISYYAIPEGLRGASLGKWICGVRVTGPDKNPPGVSRAFLRAAIYVVIPSSSIWLAHAIHPALGIKPGADTVMMFGLLYSQYILLGLLFCTMRRCNGFAAIHDLLTKTRVIRKVRHQERPVLVEGEAAMEVSETKPKVGPYHVLETLEKTDAGEWLLAYDTKLLRKIWLRVVPAGTPPVTPHWRTLGRAGRLRWITGRRSARENWDAFEGLSGKPLVGLLDQPQPWSHVRFWLLDLASEIAAAEKDGSLPEVLARDRVWITGDGRAKLLDFRAPGAPASEAPATRDTKAFLSEVACAALGGAASPKPPARVGPTRAICDAKDLLVPMPVHARKFLESLPALPGAEAIAASIRPLLQNIADVTRARRVALVLGAMAIPFVAAIFGQIGLGMYQRWMSQPDIAEMSRIFNIDKGMKMDLPWTKNQPRPSFEDMQVYISSHYRRAITNDAIWTGLGARTLIPGEYRVDAEASLELYPNPTAEQIEQATTAMKPYLDLAEAQKMMEKMQQTFWYPLVMTSGLCWMVAFWANFTALFFRGGLVMLICGVAVVRKDGRRASRGRIYWRSLVAWLPVLLAPVLMALLTPLYSAIEKKVPVPVVVESAAVRVTEEISEDTNTAATVDASAAAPAAASNAVATAPSGHVSAQITPDYDASEITGLIYLGLCVGMLSLVPTLWSLMLRGRSLQDRIAGTTLVPR
jgi:eukaryotic-like serine/threonine-protein kinase